MTQLNEKQRDQLAQVQLIKQYGQSFFRLPIQERLRLRDIQRKAIDAAYATNVSEAKPEEKKYGDFVDNPIPQTSPEFDKAAEALGPKAAPDTLNTNMPPRVDSPDTIIQIVPKKHEAFSLDIELNAKQTLGAEYAEKGQSFVFTGAAGTGKTTGCREIAKRLLKSGKLREHDFKLSGGERILAPSIAFSAFTNRATDNIRRALHKDPELEQILTHNIVTIHKLLEYEPVFYDIMDEETGEMRTTMRFEPKRTASNPLRLTHLVIEESSMLGTDLGMKLLEALPKDCQIIYVGDINQLPPIFTKSMLNYALILLPVVELTEVYRQALESPIITEAHNCLAGKELQDHTPYFKIVSGKNLKTIPSESGCVNQLANSLKSWYNTYENDARKYDPEQDIVLSPWNKGECGTDVLNNHIAQFIGYQRKALVYEVFAGMRKLYLAVGDRVMVAKQDGYITKINHNGQYLGRMPRPANSELTRFGIQLIGNKDSEYEDLELSLTSYASLNVDDIKETNDQKMNDASHVVYVKLDSGQEVSLRSVGDFSAVNFTLGYALTVHKAQGCEWRKVFIMIHRNHAISLNREMLYTAITRAREYCIIIDLCNMLPRAIENQRIKGNSVEEKIEWFNSEISLAEPVPVVPWLDVKYTEPEGTKAKKKEVPFSPFVSQHAPVKLQRLSDCLSNSLKDEFNAQLYKRWDFVRTIYGDRIGNYPTLDFELQRSRIVGLANLRDHQIKLNPLWCLLGESNAHIKDQMIGETLDHEIAHLVAYKFSQDRGHSHGWITAMKLMNREPKVFAGPEDLPDWASSYKDLLENTKSDLRGKNVDVTDDYTHGDYDEI